MNDISLLPLIENVLVNDENDVRVLNMPECQFTVLHTYIFAVYEGLVIKKRLVVLCITRV